jgi:FixJ family two-component response regulator
MNGVSAQPRFFAEARRPRRVAGGLRLSEITVKIHRGHMTKLRVQSLADLVRAA